MPRRSARNSLASGCISLEPGKDADLVLYDGDPFEFTTRCLATLIDGREYAGEREF